MPAAGVDATYAELMTMAGAHIRVASAQLVTDTIITREDAEHTARLVRELVHALGAQARVLVGPPAQSRAVLDSSRPDPVSLAAARFAHTLGDAVSRRPMQPELVSSGSLARHYKNAAVAVRTATDLLLTQTDIHGRSRNPDAQRLLSPRGRIVALDDVAKLTVQLAETRQTLHEQVRSHAGLRHPIDAVPELFAARETARDVQTLAARVLDDDPSLQQITWLQATPRAGASMPIRTPDPLDELRIRTDRLRQTAWQMVSADSPAPVGHQTLAAFAAVGAAVNTSAAVVGARLAGKDIRSPDLPGPLQGRLAKAQAWRVVRGGLLKLRTATHLDRAVAAETSSLLRLVARMAPAERGTGALGHREWEPRVYVALTGATEALDQVAGWNSRALTQAALRGEIYLPGKLLTGAQVTDDPELVTAKLANRPVQAPDTTVAAIRLSYRDAAAAQPAAPQPLQADHGQCIQPPGS